MQGLALSTFQVVLVPTILGVLTNEFFPGVVKKLKSVLPLVGVALTTLLCASPCAQVATILRCHPAIYLRACVSTVGVLWTGCRITEESAGPLTYTALTMLVYASACAHFATSL